MVKLLASARWNSVTNSAGFATGTSDVAPLDPPWTLSKASVAPGAAADGLDYYIRFTDSSGKSVVFDGKSLFALSHFSFGATQTLNIGGSVSGVGAGKVQFSSLSFSLTQSVLTPDLLRFLSSATPIKEIDVFGYDAKGQLAREDSFGLVGFSALDLGGNGDIAVTADYGALSLRNYGVDSKGAVSLAQSGAWNRVRNISGFSTNGTGTAPALNGGASLATQPVVGAGAGQLTYYVRFTLASGASGPFDGATLYQLENFVFGARQSATIGSQSSGAGASAPSFEPLTLEFSQAALTPQLLRFLAAGAIFSEIDVLGYDGGGHLASVDSFGLVAASALSIGDGADFSASFGYGSQALRIYSTDSNGVVSLAQSASWDRVRNVAAFSTGAGAVAPLAASTKLDTSLVAAAQPVGALSYYVRFTPFSDASGGVDGATFYQLNGFSFDAAQSLNIGGQSSGVGAGKVDFQPLTLSLTQAGLTPKLLSLLASGTPLAEVDVLGYDAGGHLAREDSFGLVGLSALALGADPAYALTLDYGALSLRSYVTDDHGATSLSQSGAWNVVRNIQGFSSDGTSTAAPLAASLTLAGAPALSPAAPATLTYYVRFTLASGATGPFDGATLYQLQDAQFSALQTVSIGSKSGGSVAGKVDFQPLTLSFTQGQLTPQLLQLLASGASFREIDLLAYDAGGHLAREDSFGNAGASALNIVSGEAVGASFDYGAQSLQVYQTNSSGAVSLSQSASWDRVRNVAGFSTGSGNATPLAADLTLDPHKVAAPAPTDALTYYVRFASNGAHGLSFDGATLYQLSNYAFDATQTLNIGSQSSGTGAGKVEFKPLTLSFTQGALTPKLLSFLAAGLPLSEVDVVGYDSQGHLAREDSFGLTAATSLTVASNAAFTATLDYGALSLRNYTTDQSGLTSLSQSGQWDVVRNIRAFSTGQGTTTPFAAALTLDPAAVAPTESVGDLHYYVRFTPAGGANGVFDGKTLYQVQSFGFNDQQTASIGSASSGVGAGKAVFHPATLGFSQFSLAPQALTMLASGASFSEIDVLAYDGAGDLKQAYNFGRAAADGLVVDDSGASSLSFEYGSEAISAYANDAPSCFCAGVRIATPQGWRAVEDLAIGDVVVAGCGAAREILWVGRREISAQEVDPLRFWPVRICAGALGGGLPERDLLLSPDHALLVGGLLVHAGALVNGDTIRRERVRAPRFCYYHLELERHELIFAEGAAVESFVDSVDRIGFDNWREHRALFPQGRAVAEMALPRVRARRQLPALLRQILVGEGARAA